jgi:hypothetical protein
VSKKLRFDVLPPNHPDGFHQRRGERIAQKTIEIGKAKFQDFITRSTLVECDLRILCSAGSVNLFESTFERCVFHPRRELRNLRLTGLKLRACQFFGRYVGCRFGNEDENEASEVRNCDFSQANLFHLCDFLDGADVESLKWPAWPHIVVTDLPQSRRDWLRLTLPEELRIIQEVIGAEDSLARAVSVFLPSETQRYQELRELLESQTYIAVG